MTDWKNKFEELSAEHAVYKKHYAEFIEIAAHDLQAPLRKLSVLTERLTAKYEPVDGGDVTQYTGRINSCLSELRSMIDGLKELAEANPETLHLVSCDIDQLLKRLVSEATPEFREQDTEVLFSELPVIEADRTQCRQIFKHLLDNAYKFRQTDKPLRIKIGSERLSDQQKKEFALDQAKNYFRIEFADNGIGFNQEFAEKIFSPFVRTNGKSAYEGNGLGLAIVQRIVHNHSGLVFAAANENEGSRFILILPEKP